MTYAEFQSIRVVFRFLMVIPLLILGFDGIAPHHHVNASKYVALVLWFVRSAHGYISPVVLSYTASGANCFQSSQPLDVLYPPVSPLR